MSTHTPRPWRRHDDDYCPEEIYGDLDGPLEDGQIRGTLVCTIEGDHDEDEQVWANGQLILAAPELLEACEAAMGAMGAHGPCKNNNCSDCKRAWKMLHAAIAKATGGKS